jgi:hypothetical protein
VSSIGGSISCIQWCVLITTDGQCIVTTIRQKTREDKVAWAARLASTWLLEKVKERRFVKGQTHEETCRASGKWNVNEEKRGEARASNSDTKKHLETDAEFRREEGRR